MDNAQPGPGPSTARIRFTLPPGPRPPPSSLDTAPGASGSTSGFQSSEGYLTSNGDNGPNSSQSYGYNARPPTRGVRRRRGTGAPRGRGAGAGSRHNPPRHSSVRASTRISQLSDADPENPNAARKLTLSFNKNGTAKSGIEVGRKTSFLGEYDRDLDENPTEPLAFEEQFVLRVPESIAGNLREMVKGKNKGLDGVEFKFLDARRAAFKFDGKTYASKLVDLPNIIESQKTFDSRHLFKVADISQMLVVEDRVNDESTINASALNIDDYFWPHGITPPLRHVRKRRFRKRISRRAIEVVEEQVEELLSKDEGAEDLQTDLIDVNPGADVPDSYYIEYDPDAVWYTQNDGEGSEFGGSEMYDDPGSVVPQSDLDENGFYDDQGELEEGSDEEEYDDDLAAALREELAEGSDDNVASDAGDGSGDDEDEEGARSGDDEEDEDIAEKKAKVKQFTGEIKILEATIEKKRSGFTGGNPIMVKRFEETIAGLQADVNTKVSARQSILAELDSIAVAKAQAQKPVEAAKRSTGPVSAFTPDDRPQDDDEDEEEEEDGAYTAANTPTPAIAHREEEDDQDEDLFGDDDDEYETDNDDQAIAVSADEPAQSMPVLGDDGSSSEPEAEIDEEMAAMLAAEMSAMDDIEGNEEDTEAADAALRDLQSMDVELQEDDSNMDFGQDSFFDQKPTFGVEGGVGMRRLATGVMDEGDSDSDDSDD